MISVFLFVYLVFVIYISLPVRQEPISSPELITEYIPVWHIGFSFATGHHGILGVNEYRYIPENQDILLLYAAENTALIKDGYFYPGQFRVLYAEDYCFLQREWARKGILSEIESTRYKKSDGTASLAILALPEYFEIATREQIEKYAPVYYKDLPSDLKQRVEFFPKTIRIRVTGHYAVCPRGAPIPKRVTISYQYQNYAWIEVPSHATIDDYAKLLRKIIEEEDKPIAKDSWDEFQYGDAVFGDKKIFILHEKDDKEMFNLNSIFVFHAGREILGWTENDTFVENPN